MVTSTRLKAIKDNKSKKISFDLAFFEFIKDTYKYLFEDVVSR